MYYHGTMSVQNNELTIGGVSSTQFKEKWGTPLIIYDQALIEQQCRTFTECFQSETIRGEIAYASKAFTSIGMLQLMEGLNMSLDASSAGELYTAIKAGFPMHRVYFHGNNKLPEEIELAVEADVEAFIIDHRQEISTVETILREKGKTMKVYLRINPGIEAHTHDYIKTAKHDSKFGESIFDPEIDQVIQSIIDSDVLELVGFHCHIGSQIFAQDSFFKAAAEVLDYVAHVEEKFSISLPSLDLGGGFGVYYTEEDHPFALDVFLRELMAFLEAGVQERKLAIRHVLLEPGRSIVCNAGSTLYTVGATKTTFSGRKYCFIDGGMSDNPRPALYQAVYEATIANRSDALATTHYSVAGKLCESGDVLIKDAYLPEVHPGDLLLLSSTGAYTYSMSSNYNRLTRPAVVLVKEGCVRCLIQRQTLEDLVRLDQSL